MTTYGTIPTSSSPGAKNLDYGISRAKETLKAGLGYLRPWKEMFDYRSVGFPASFGDAMERIRTNLNYFLMNYAIVVLLILFLSLLWHPISLIVFLVLLGVWLYLYFLRDDPLVIFSRTISDRVILIVLLVLTIFLLLFTNATANILISLLIGAVVVVIHAVLRKTDNLAVDEESGPTAALFAGVASVSS